MDEVKFKRAMSISASRILNISRCVIDDDITQDEFFKIMFILASLEEAKWDEEELRNKAKSYVESLSKTARKELEAAIEECKDMYVHYWDLIDKQNKRRNFKKSAGTGKTEIPVQEKKKPNDNVDSDFWWDAFSGELMILPNAINEVIAAGISESEIAKYLEENRNTFDLPFNPYSIDDVIDMYMENEKQMKRQYPAAPSRGR